QLYSREVGSNDWDEVDHPSGYREGHTLDIVNVGGTIYAAFFDHDDADGAVFTLDTANDKWTKVWSQPSGAEEIMRLIGINETPEGDSQAEELYAVVRTDDAEYDVYHVDGTTGTRVIEEASEVIDGAYVDDFDDSDNERYALLTASTFYLSGTADGSFDAYDPTDAQAGGMPSDATNFGGIWTENADSIYVSSKNGRVYRWDGSWSHTDQNDDRQYLGGAVFDFTGSGGEEGVVVGLDTQDESSGGYYEVDSSLGTSRPDGNNYSAAELSGSVVHSFFVDVNNDTLFALTNGHGLWSTDYDTAEPEWRWE
ncbi:MAG: hypothetical protein ACLFS5_13610, partial [Spirochaetaceae bacterium]